MATRKILIVDDSAIDRNILKEMLKTEYAIIEAASGEEALDILYREYNGISAVLLDIVLPGIDGYGVLASIRSDKRLVKMPVIMVTASEDETTRIKSLELKANDYVRKPYSQEILKHCLKNNIAVSEASIFKSHGIAFKPRLPLKAAAVMSFIIAFIISVCIQHFIIQGELYKTCKTVTVDFTEIMDSYRHSFKLFELLLQEKIKSASSTEEIEAFLKTHDKHLLEIEGGDYDGVYMYYQGKYLYSWDTPSSVYTESGYDVAKRPWYIGAVAAKGEIFFSTPYPSYANDYMLATISRLQEDGETVIAYDIKLGEITKFVNRLYLYNGALALICDTEGNIIGSTNNLYLGGNYTLTLDQLRKAVLSAQSEIDKDDMRDEAALKSAEAQQQFVSKKRNFLNDMIENREKLRYSISNLSFGYAYSNEYYTCFVITPMSGMLIQIAILWAAISFMLILIVLLIYKINRKNHQILSDTLTGLNNRRAFLKYCDNHIQHHADENIGLLMLDLNHFKKINDMYGHSVGDQALLDASAVLKNACVSSKNSFFLCRYGGDEFLLVGRVQEEKALIDMRALITEGFKRKNQTSMTPYVLEASVGIAYGVCGDKKSLELLLTQADHAMYEEKRQ